MRELLPQIQEWRDAGKKIALATVVLAEGSAPRREGARLVVSEDGEMAGSVSGGCVEGDVINQALDVLVDGTPRLLRYAITSEMVWDVGLACGGTVEVFVEPLEEPRE